MSLLAWLVAVAAVSADTGHHRLARLEHTVDHFEAAEPSWPAWQTTVLGLETRFRGFTTIAELLRFERFHDTDVAGAFEAYSTLWPTAYGRARVQLAPDAELIPRADFGGDVYQVMGDWELSAGYRHLFYQDEQVGLASAGVARQLHNWYLRARVGVVTGVEESATSFAGQARWLGARGGTFELSGASGREVVELGAGPPEVRDAWSLGLRTVRFIRRWGVSAGAGYAVIDDVPGRISLSLGLLARW